MTNLAESGQIRPILKWAGGKRQVLPAIRPLVPRTFRRFIEPFLGGGAVLFDLVPSRAIVNDLNSELISTYTVVRDFPDDLIDALASMPITSEAFYEIRSWDRYPETFASRSPIEKAARTIYLNRLGFNGLYRVNSRNQFNVPYGKHRNPKVCDRELIHRVSDYLARSNIRFHNEDFRRTIRRAREGDFIYLDPPYAPLDNATSSFTSYTSEGFGIKDLVELSEELGRATSRGASWLLSNVKSRETLRLFPKSQFLIVDIDVSRPINSSGAGRGSVTEILVMPR